MKHYIIVLSLLSVLPLSAQQAYTLEECQQMAQNHNIALRTADANIEMAKEQRHEAFTHYFPTLSANGMAFNANKETMEMAIMGMHLGMVKNGLMGAVTAVQPIFAGGQIINANRLAKTGVAVSQLQRQLNVNEVALTTEQYYWQIIALQEKQKTLQTLATLLARLHNDVAVAVKAGVVNRNDLLQVQLKENEVESHQLKVSNGLALARMVLAQYIGADTARLNFPATSYNFSLPDFALSNRTDHVAALRHTTEYQLLEENVAAKKLQQKMELGKRLPTVGVGASYAYHDLLDNDRSFATMFAQVSIPISDWWGGSHAIKRRRLAVQIAQDELQNKAELLVIRMQKNWNDVEEAYKQLQIAHRGKEQAEENLRLNTDYYKAGTCKMSDLLEAQAKFQQTHDNYCDAYAQYRIKLLEYKQSVGK